jgi:hypothetical protein
LRSYANGFLNHVEKESSFQKRKKKEGILTGIMKGSEKLRNFLVGGVNNRATW